MATVMSAIKMMDSMSGPLKQITSSMNIMIGTMDKMQKSTDQNVNVDKQLLAAQKQISAAEAEINRQIAQSDNEQKKFNDSVKQGKSEASGLVGKITALAAAYLGINQVKSFLSNAWGGANEQIRSEQRLQSIMKNINGMTQDGIDLVKQRAQELEKTTDISQAAGIYGQSQLAEYVYDPKNIAGMTEAMYNLATETYGANVSQDQLAQTANMLGKVMMGDINALSRNGFKIDAIFTEAEQKLLKTGTEAERAAMVIQMIDENLSGLAESVAQTPEGAVLQFANAWGAVQEKIGYGLMPLVMQLTQLFMDKLPLIESVLMSVFGTLFNVFQGVLTASVSVVEFIVNNWTTIEPIIWGIAAATTAWYIATNRQAIMSAALAVKTAISTVAIYAQIVATLGLKAAWQGLNTAMKANIIILIISLVVGLIVWLIKLWQTNDSFAAGLMRAWNVLLGFFDQIPIFFVKVGNGITNAFQSMKVESLKIVESLVNSVISNINWLIDKLNMIPGVSIDAIAQVEFSSSAAAEAEAIKQAGQDNILSMQEDAAIRAAEREQKVLDMLDDRAAKREQKDAEKNSQFTAPELYGAGDLGNGMWDVGDGKLLNVDKVKEVGKIKDTVDISSEDLKIMRELADMKNVQNFVNLTPSINFGDTHVRNESDIDTIISKVTEKLNEDIASSVDSVYV